GLLLFLASSLASWEVGKNSYHILSSLSLNDFCINSFINTDCWINYYLRFILFCIVSESDCYVTLWLPTASPEKIRTKTIKNCKNPVWNEAFCYRIDRRVKNMLELKVCDEDTVTKDDELCTVLFDISKLNVGPTARVTFQLNPEVSNTFREKTETLVWIFLLNSSLYFYFVSREISCLEVKVDGYVISFLSLLSPQASVGRAIFIILSICEMQRLSESETSCKFCVHTFVMVFLCSSQQGHDVRLGFDLCTQEHNFLHKRKKYVAAALKKVLHLEEDLQEHEVPVVAIMTTGGGTRSFTAMFGSLLGLQKLNLLDCISYISGLSGTTWTMANLYEDANWSQKYLEEAISEARKQVTKSKMNCFSTNRLKYYHSELKERAQEGYKTSFIDLWGLIIESMLHDEKDNHKLSDQHQAVNDGQNPLPIYVAINLKDKYSAQDFKEWLEFTPYEVGFLKYGASVRSEDFGSEFFMGRLIKKLPETRICYMQGMWSSIFSVDVMYFWNLAGNSEDFWNKWTRDRVKDIEDDPVPSTKPHELETRLFTSAGPLSDTLRDVLTGRPTVAEYPNFLRGFQMDNDYLANEQFSTWKDTVLDCYPNKLMGTAENTLSLVDAGFFINNSYPPLLRSQRKVDVILHLSYNGGSQTLPLEQVGKYTTEQGIPFPKIRMTEEDKKTLKECYVFEDAENPRAPIVLFFPLVNDTYKNYKAPGVERTPTEMEEGKIDVSTFRTREVSFSEESFDNLVKLTDYNILNNENLIVQALRAAVERRKQEKE
uniref:Phospholipase A2 n=1 Tax=Crocodylus porosus TaxID=8502 RepID=A0A7M4G3A3_CROPO